MMARPKRPPKPVPGTQTEKRKTTSTRITPETRAQLEEAAALSGRSIAQEIELRLDRSFLGYDQEQAALRLIGLNPDAYLAWRCFGDAISTIERQTGSAWRNDWDTCQQVGSAFEAILKAFGPERPDEGRLSPEGRMKSDIRRKENIVSGYPPGEA